MTSPINKCQIAFLIDTNLAVCDECNHISEILLTVTRLLLFYAENCKKPIDQNITTDEKEILQSSKPDIHWGFKFFNSSFTNFKKSTFHTKFENFHKASMKDFEKNLKEAFQSNDDRSGTSSKLCSHAAYFLSKALTEILHDFNWAENENSNFASPITRKKGNFQVEESSSVNMRKIIFLLTKSPYSQRALRRFSNKLIMDAEVFLDSFMSPALLNEYQNKYKIAVHWIDMTSEQCKTSFDTDRHQQNDTVKVRTIVTETCKMLGGNFIAKDDILRIIPAIKDNNSLAEKYTCAVSSQNLLNFLPIEVCLDQLIRHNNLHDEIAQVFVSGKNLDDLIEQLVPLTKNHHLSEEDGDKGLDLKNARITWMGCVPHKDVVHLLATKIMTSFILDCNGSDQLSQLHSLLQKTATLGVLSVTREDLEIIHISVLQPFANGIAILSLLNIQETFHGENVLLDKLLAEDGKIDQKDLHSGLLNKILDHVKEQKQRSSPVKPVAPNVQVDSVYQSHYLNSWYMPGSLHGMSTTISRLNISNSETTSRSEKSFLKELRKHYIKEKQPPEVVQNFHPSTSTPICAIRKKKTDSADSDASSRSSRVSVRTLRSSTLSRGRLMVDKARSASVLNVGETDISLLSTPSSPDKRSCNSDSYLHIDLKTEQDLKTHILKLYDQVLFAGVAVETTIRTIISVITRFMTSLQHSDPHKSAADFIRQLLVKTSKELRDKYAQNNDKNTKIAEYKLQILLLLELEFVRKTEETDNSSLLNELTLLLRGLMFLTETKYLHDFLNDTIIVSYSAALPQLLADVYDELMLPLPPALSKFASPVSTKPSFSESNEESFLSAPGSTTQVSSHHSDQASQQTRSRFKQHPSISDFRHSKQILVKPKPKVEAKSKTKEKVKIKTRSSRKRHAGTSSADVGRAKRNLFSDKSKVSQTKSKDEVKSSHKKKSKHSGKAKTLVLGTPSHKQTSQRFIRQQERLRQRENIDPDVKVVAESPLKEDDDPCLSSAVTKSARHLLRESFYSSSSQPSRHFSKSLELSQSSSGKINLAQENQVHFSKSQGTLSSAIRGDSPNISPRTRFMKSFIASPSPKHKAKSLLRRSPRKSSKKLDFKNSAGRVSTDDVHLIFDGENANDFGLMVSPTRRRFSGSVAAMGYKTPEKQNRALQWETASCPPLMVTPVKRFTEANSELGFKNAISQSGDKRAPESKTPVKNMVLRSTPTRNQKMDSGFSTPVKGAGPCSSVEYKSPKKVNDINSSPAKTKSLITARSGPCLSFQCTPKKVELDEHYSTPKKYLPDGRFSHYTPNKVKFSSIDLGCPLVERIPPSIETATPKKSILKNSPLIKVARRVELQAVTSPSRPYSFMGKGLLDSRLTNALSQQDSFVSEKCSKQEGDYTSPEHGKSFSLSRLQDGHSGQGYAPATVTIRTPSPSCKTKCDSINTWARKKKCSKQYSPPSKDMLSPSKTSKALFHSSPHRNIKETTEVETPKKATSCLETLHPRKRSLFLVDDVVESPSKRLRKCPESPYSNVSLAKTDTVDFDPGKSPVLFDDERDGYGDFKDFQPSSASVFSQSSNSQHSASLPHCVLTPVKRVTRNSSAALDEGSQGFPVFIPALYKDTTASVQQQCVHNVSKTDSPQPISAQSAVFIDDKKQYSPILSSNGLWSLIASPLLSPTSSDHRLALTNSRSTHSKSRKHLELQ